MVKKSLRACSLRGGEKTVWRVDCCRRANKKFGETLTRRERDSSKGCVRVKSGLYRARPRPGLGETAAAWEGLDGDCKRAGRKLGREED